MMEQQVCDEPPDLSINVYSDVIKKVFKREIYHSKVLLRMRGVEIAQNTSCLATKASAHTHMPEMSRH